MPIIEVDHVVKRYRLGQTHGLRESLARLIGRKPDRPSDKFNALDDVTFSVEPGEVLGIIGSNGAGKSTLLKILSGITTPTTGRMTARGRIAPLIEVGAGLIADLTGRENIYLNGVILGMSVAEIKRKFDEIVAFAELEQFIDTPIKRYSSGMAVRLGFSIATAVDCEILIVDEVLAVGDIAFQRKCFDRMEEIIKQRGTTVLLVSHNIRQVQRLCTRALLLDHGKVIEDGDTQQTCKEFFERTNARVKSLSGVAPVESISSAEYPDFTLISVAIVDDTERSVDVVSFRRDICVQIEFSTSRSMNRPVFGVGVHTSDMLYLATHDSDRDFQLDTLVAGTHVIRCLLRDPPLVPGVYSLRFGVSEDGGATQGFYRENLLHFQVSDRGSVHLPPVSPDGFFALDGHWTTPSPVVKRAKLLEVA